MGTAIGVGLIATGIVMVYAANFVFYAMQEELTKTFPEKTDWILGSSTKETIEFFKTQKMYAMHKEAFPKSKKRNQTYALFLCGVVAALAGFASLINFK